MASTATAAAAQSPASSSTHQTSMDAPALPTPKIVCVNETCAVVMDNPAACVDDPPMAELEMCQQLVVRVAIASGTGWGLQCAHDAGCWYSCWHGSHCSLQLRP